MKGKGVKEKRPQLPFEAMTQDGAMQALALGTGDLLRTSLNIYTTYVSDKIDAYVLNEESEALLNSIIDKKNSGFTSKDSFKRLLLSPLAQDVMYLIWRESEFIHEASLFAAGLARQFGSTCSHITRNSIKNLICNSREDIDASKADAIKRSVDRICDALEVYNFIERENIRENLKPLKGTHNLHALMMGAHIAVAQLFAKQLQSKEGGQNGQDIG